MHPVILFALLAALPVDPGPADLPIAAFTAHQVWSTDDGRSIASLGWPHQAVFLVHRGLSMPASIKVPARCSLYEAGLAPTRDLVAYSLIGWDAPRFGNDPSGWAVVVADTAGREQARFPGARRFQWSPDGARLALAYAHHDTNWSWTPEAIGLWRRSEGASRRRPQVAADLRWGDGDTLFLEIANRIEALDLESGRLSHTNHRGPDVSPDGRFSLRHYTSVASGTQVFDDQDSLDLSHCALYQHGAPPLGGFQPFWVRAGSAGHLKCTTIGEGPSAPARQAGLATGLFDPRTLAMVARFPGKPIVPTADGRGVVVVRGDSLAVEPIADAREPARGRTVRLRMEVQTWGRGLRPLGTWTHSVAEGEWVPDHALMLGACDRHFRIARIVDPEHVEIEIPSGRYIVRVPGVPATQAGTTSVSRVPTRLRTNSTDGGYVIDLSIVD